MTMGFLKEIKRWLGLDPDSDTTINQIGKDNPLFVYIKIPADIQPLDRGKLFEGPLQEALERENLGTITGGGSLLSAPDENNHRSIEYCGIDVDLYDPIRGLALLKRELIRLDSPQGTTLLYELEGREWEEAIYHHLPN